MTNDNKMPDVIYALEGKSDTYDGIWDERQWSDQSGIEYHHSRIVEVLKAENEELRAKLDKAKDALGFYSISWVNQSYGSDDGKPSHRLTKDKGCRARTTLDELI